MLWNPEISKLNLEVVETINMAPHNAVFPTESFSRLVWIWTLHKVLFIRCQKFLHCKNKTCYYAFGVHLFLQLLFKI